MKNSYRSMRGKAIDLQKLMAQQDKNISVGNTKSNARGDQLGRGGRVIKSADDIANEHYNKNNPKAVVQASIKIDEPEQKAKVQKKVVEKPQEDDWEEPVTTPEVKSEPVKETEEEDPWVETKDGDFVRQSELQGDNNNERVSKPKTSRKQSTNKSAQRKGS
jgi:hypothetical protein